MMSMNLSDIAILNIKGSNYRYIVSLISKWGHKVNAKFWFDRKKWSIIKHKNLLSLIKMGKENLSFGNMEMKKSKIYRHRVLFF